MDISSMLEVQVKEVRVEPNVKENGEYSGSKGKATSKGQAYSTTIEPIPVSAEEQNYYQLTFGNDIASIRYRRLHCTACDTHIGSAPSQAHNMLEHPVLRTLLCARCREFYGDGTFEQGDDATDMFCRWCANGGNLYCCSYCSNTFCYKCIRRNFVSRVRKKIEADEKWQCFVCNPTDLYDMRAVCWALLRHVQTVTSILRNEKNMSPEMIKEKMNLDESECCPRRSKRKNGRQKRKVKTETESNSEDEDETYVPKFNGIPILIKRKPPVNQYKKSKLRYSEPNGTKQERPLHVIPFRLPLSSLPSKKPDESKSLFPQNEPAKIDCQEAVVKVLESTVIPPQSKMNLIDSSMPSRYESSAIPPSLYHTAIINQNAASTTYIRSTMTNSAFHQIILPPPPPVQQIRSSSYNSSRSLRNSTNAMVSISKQMENRSRQLIFPTVRTSEETLTPNIIDLDSDSDDEPKVVKQHNKTNDMQNVDLVDISSDKIIPVALFSTENDNSIKEDQPLIEVCTTLKKPPSSFSDIMLTHSRELSSFLGNLKESVHNFFTLPDNETVKDSKLTADRKIKLFHKNMRKTVFQLSHINDRVIREYNKWERSRKIETETSSINQNTVMPRENIDIPLNMICVNESDTESDYDKSEYQIMESSDHIKSNNILEDLLLFRKSVKHCGVGNSAATTENKAIQVYDVLSKDYEKCIGYSLLTKAHYENKIDEDVLEPVEISNESFDKYQEQFIFYLQHIEDNGIETEDMKGLEDLDKTFEKSIKPDSPDTLESRQNIDLLIASTEKSGNCNQEKSAKSCVNFPAKTGVPANTTDMEITQTNNDSDSNNEIHITSIQSTEKIGEKMELPKVENDATTLNNDDVSPSKNADDAVNTEAAATESEDCTIIED